MYLSHIFQHKFWNIYIRHRFENADNVIDQVRTFADSDVLELEGRGGVFDTCLDMTGHRVGSNSASLFPTRFSIGWHPLFRFRGEPLQ